MRGIQKAVVAAVAAFLASVQAAPPHNTNDWLMAGVAGLAAGAITWYVPNSGTVIPKA